MINNADEARKYLSKITPSYEYHEAFGYLAALNGPEVKALAEALSGGYVQGSNGIVLDKNKVEAALAQYRAAAKEIK